MELVLKQDGQFVTVTLNFDSEEEALKAYRKIDKGLRESGSVTITGDFELSEDAVQ